MKLLRDCNCRACRSVPKRTARRDAEVRRAMRADRRRAKRGLEAKPTSLNYRF